MSWLFWHSRRNWERFARTDPLWAVLTDPDKRGNRWEADAFFHTGRGDVAADMQRVAALWPDLRRGRALDFGCGVGRLTQALAGHFDEVTGVDVSAGMLDLARGYDRSGGRVRYVHNTRPDLACFADGSFDFVYSLITLQHVPPPHGEAYIAEFMRVLAPGGVAVFQVPGARLRPDPHSPWAPKAILRRTRRALLLSSHMGMFPVPRARVEALLGAAGASVEAQASDSCGPDYESWRYCARKPGGEGHLREPRDSPRPRQ